MKVWLVLTMWRDIEHTIKICYSEEEANKHFKEVTGSDWNELGEESWDEFNLGNWGGSQIQEQELKGVVKE